jgi:hypothetical protein
MEDKMAATPRVPFTVANIKKCVCGKCPVQTNSQCSKNKMADISEALGHVPLQADAIPAAYCASGKASCGDLDFSKMCMCGACPVYDEYSLAATTPMGYYCRDGKAK